MDIESDDATPGYRLRWPGRNTQTPPDTAAPAPRRRNCFGLPLPLPLPLGRVDKSCQGWPVALRAPGEDGNEEAGAPRIRITGHPFA